MQEDSQEEQIKPFSLMETPDTPAVRFRAGVQKNMDVLLVRVIRTVISAVDRQTARHRRQSQHHDR